MIDGCGFWLESHHCVRLRVDTDGDGVSDAWEDSDGDGAFNIQELMIGKNPANPHDVHGFSLIISILFDASSLYINLIKYSFALASEYIYDYTDGYIFISNITIFNNVQELSTEYNISNVYINETLSAYGYTIVGLYANETHWGINETTTHIWLDGRVLIQSTKWFAAVIGHEFGHYAFAFGEEYVDKDGKFYESYEISLGWGFSINFNDYLSKRGVRTVMGLGRMEHDKEIDLRELSSWQDYETLSTLIDEFDLDCSWETHQWYGWTTGWGLTYWPKLSYGFCWYVLVFMLTNYPKYHVYPTLWFDSDVVCLTNVDDILLEYTPLRGPLTAVGQYMWVSQ